VTTQVDGNDSVVVSKPADIAGAMPFLATAATAMQQNNRRPCAAVK
jgi:hypothetical protein